jgi:hypothetical protein
LTLTTDNGTQFTSARYVETLNQLGITHRRTAHNHPEGNSYIERFHRSLKEEEVWLNEYQNFAQAKLSIARWIEEYNHDRPHRGLHGRTPHDARAVFAQTMLKPSLQTRPHVSSLTGCTTSASLEAHTILGGGWSMDQTLHLFPRVSEHEIPRITLYI